MTNQEITKAITEDFNSVTGSDYDSLNVFAQSMHARFNTLTNVWVGLMALVFGLIYATIPMTLVIGFVLFGGLLLALVCIRTIMQMHYENKVIKVANLPSNIDRTVLNSMYDTMRENNRKYLLTLKELDIIHETYLDN